MTVRILTGDARAMLATLPDASVHMCVTSPPYFGLRDYETAQWEGGDPACDHRNGTLVSPASTLRSDGRAHVGPYDGEKAVTAGMPFRGACGKCGAIRVDKQIGLEPTLADYIAGMVGVLREVRRVLREDGTCWLNIGDAYAGSWGAQSQRVTEHDVPSWHSSQVRNHPRGARNIGSIRDAGLKSKDLMLVPARLALALQADGWWVRKDIIWAKPNPMPESCTDRPTSSHEHIFLLTKAERYFFDAEAVREGRTSDEDAREFRGGCYVGGETNNSTTGKRQVVGNRKIKVPGGWDRGEGAHGTIHRDGRTSAEYQEAEVRAGRNIRDVWTMATAPFPEAHFATFPPELPDRCIRAGTSERGCCTGCGAPWQRVLGNRRETGGRGAGNGFKRPERATYTNADGTARGDDVPWVPKARDTIGWSASCDCADASGFPLPVRPCTVLDPFLGSGTTAMVADALGRDAIGIELNPGYVAMAERRIAGARGELRIEGTGLFADVPAPAPIPLFEAAG